MFLILTKKIQFKKVCLSCAQKNKVVARFCESHIFIGLLTQNV